MCVCVRLCTCVEVWKYIRVLFGGRWWWWWKGEGGGRGRAARRSHLGMVITAGAVVTKLRPHGRLLSAASILGEQPTHYREGGAGEGLGGRNVQGGGVARPAAEGLILNVLQRQCLLSSLASPLTAAASKQEPPPPRFPHHTERKHGSQWFPLLLLPAQMVSLLQKVGHACACFGKSLSCLVSSAWELK